MKDKTVYDLKVETELSMKTQTEGKLEMKMKARHSYRYLRGSLLTNRIQEMYSEGMKIR